MKRRKAIRVKFTRKPLIAIIIEMALKGASK